ncbi:hypothetical protein [Actinomycetospora sp. NBRC 106375]|uniref:hypothetical protein n=1 Tax=Actinomycetospora sp. NBRC 106375 TaxID=3032207 RepID=UPI0025526FA8|nr:hypothetical protein [Actinomycetospora sp. NBRC 106375]
MQDQCGDGELVTGIGPQSPAQRGGEHPDDLALGHRGGGRPDYPDAVTALLLAAHRVDAVVVGVGA